MTSNNKKKKDAPKQKKEFAIFVKEFAGSLPISKIESRDAFAALMDKELPRGTKRLRSEWQKDFDLFMAKPVAISWADWLEQNNGGKK